jgi:hypothetical protein
MVCQLQFGRDLIAQSSDRLILELASSAGRSTGPFRRSKKEAKNEALDFAVSAADRRLRGRKQ